MSDIFTDPNGVKVPQLKDVKGQYYHGPKGLLFVPHSKRNDPKYVELLKGMKPVKMDGNRILR